MPALGQLQEKCSRGHSEWHTAPNGNRYCVVCHRDRNKRRKRPKKTPTVVAMSAGSVGDRGPQEHTFCWSEIMKARGYEFDTPGGQRENWRREGSETSTVGSH